MAALRKSRALVEIEKRLQFIVKTFSGPLNRVDKMDFKGSQITDTLRYFVTPFIFIPLCSYFYISLYYLYISLLYIILPYLFLSPRFLSLFTLFLSPQFSNRMVRAQLFQSRKSISEFYVPQAFPFTFFHLFLSSPLFSFFHFVSSPQKSYKSLNALVP